eukprot:3459113-Amphidinium_carterae.2
MDKALKLSFGSDRHPKFADMLIAPGAGRWSTNTLMEKVLHGMPDYADEILELLFTEEERFGIAAPPAAHKTLRKAQQGP